ncbi:MAG: hypothetical protein EKK62_16405 [Acidimicrobiia bacterium]|nr:MAG: hypothetical protein EKK62_16405 [Acidimicrobiia bacterium]
MDTPIRKDGHHVAERLSGRSACAFSFEAPVQATEEGEIPEWLHIFPMPGPDGTAVARDGRVFHFPKGLQAVVDATNAEIEALGPGPVDLDHKLYSWWGGGGEAVAWMHRVELRADGIWAKWEPLAEARDKVLARTYRYTSSVLAGDGRYIRDEDGWPIGFEMDVSAIEGFGLTNIPAMRVKSFLAREGASMNEETIRTVLSELGLADAADATQIRDAFRAKLAAGTDVADLRAKLTAAEERVRELEAEKAAAAAAARKAEGDALLQRALEEGKIIPSTRAYFEAQLAREGGVEEFRKFLAAQPPHEAAKPAPRSTANAKPVAVPHGVDPEAYALIAAGHDPHEAAAILRSKKKPQE